ncbi:MAG TPA: MFS transporter, partial [Symbiobacteriaceae bacterium]|nr:MFS transporter [Symbiobacteriaceae bacterium]
MSYFYDLYAQFRELPRTLKFFYATDILFGFSMAIFSTLFNLHLLAVGFTADHVGQLQSVASLVMAGLAIPVGLAADRWGRRWFYVAGSLLFGMPYLAMPWLTDFPLLLAGYTVSTIGNTLMFVNESPLLAGEVGPNKRAFVFSFMMINFIIWNTLGIQLAGFLAEWLPPGALSQYQLPLVVAGVFAVASGLGRLFLPWRKPAGARRALSLRPTRTAVLLGLASLITG